MTTIRSAAELPDGMVAHRLSAAWPDVVSGALRGVASRGVVEVGRHRVRVSEWCSLCREEFGRRHLLGWFGGGGVEEGHGAFGQVAAFGDLPFVVGLDEHGSGEAQQC